MSELADSCIVFLTEDHNKIIALATLYPLPSKSKSKPVAEYKIKFLSVAEVSIEIDEKEEVSQIDREKAVDWALKMMKEEIEPQNEEAKSEDGLIAYIRKSFDVGFTKQVIDEVEEPQMEEEEEVYENLPLEVDKKRKRRKRRRSDRSHSKDRRDDRRGRL